MKTNRALKREARKLLRPAYWYAFLACLMAALLQGNILILYNALLERLRSDSMFLQPGQIFIGLVALYFFIIGPLTVGRARYYLQGINGDWRIRHLFSPFMSLTYFRIALVMGVRMLLIAIAPSVGFFLFYIAPFAIGVVALVLFFIACLFIYYQARLIPYLLAEKPRLTFQVINEANDAISHEARFHGLFSVDYSFATWYIVGALFFGMGQYFFMPYHQMTMAMRYRELFEIARRLKRLDQSVINENTPPQNNRSMSICGILALAFIFNAFPPMTVHANTNTEIIVTTEQELRDAIYYNQSPIRIDTTITLTEGVIQIRGRRDITLRGTGTILIAHEDSPWGASRHFYVINGRLTLQDELVLTRCSSFEFGGGIIVGYSGSSSWNYSEAIFIMEGGRIEYNRPRQGGGGVYVQNGVFRMYGGVIRNNTAQNRGGGVDLFDPLENRALFVMIGGEIFGNISNERGGGVNISPGGHFVMHGGRITKNYARRYGGGIYVGYAPNWGIGSTVSILCGEISYNHAGGFGGGIGILNQDFGYEHISIESSASFFGNTAAGELYERGFNNSLQSTGRFYPHGGFNLQAGLSRYPQIRWYGYNSRPGTHLINNYDIGFISIPSWPQIPMWKIHVALASVIMFGKCIALILSVIDEKREKTQGGIT